jgi:iron complex transport system permease protein
VTLAPARPARSGAARRAGRAEPTRGTGAGWVLALLALLAASLLAAVTIGPADIAPTDVARSLLHHLGLGENPLSELRDAIVWQSRAPRALTAAAVGAGLAICGVAMQGLTRNPLADPYLLGVSAGASLGAVLVLLLGVAVLLPVAAFAGALLALTATLTLAGSAGRLSPTRAVLAGLAVAQACAAVTSFVIFWSATGDSYREILSWLLGSVAGAGWDTVAIALGALAVGVPLLLAASRTLDAFTFGDVAAAALGVHVARARWGLFVVVALLTGALVSVSGAIGFVGLVVPHAVRLLVGSRHHRVLTVSAPAGAVLLLWADTAARSVFEPRELPVGILTAALGAPVFALLLRRERVRS